MNSFYKIYELEFRLRAHGSFLNEMPYLWQVSPSNHVTVPLINLLSSWSFPIIDGSSGTKLAGGLSSLSPLSAPRKPAQLGPPTAFLFLATYPFKNDSSTPILLLFPAAQVTGRSTKQTSCLHFNCGRSRKVSQQLVCTALATGASQSWQQQRFTAHMPAQ